MALITGRTDYLRFAINQTDLLAGTAHEIVAPYDGHIEEIAGIVQVAVTTGGTLAVSINGTTVVGLTLTVANGATKGSVPAADTPTVPSATRSFRKGDRIAITPASFASAGAVSGHLTIRSGAAGLEGYAS